MPSDTRRRDAATAATGAVGLATGGGMRHAAVSSMKKAPRFHLPGVLRHGTKGQKRLFLAGSTLGLLSAAPLGVGTTRLVTGDVGKAFDPNKPIRRLSDFRRGSLSGAGMGGAYYGGLGALRRARLRSDARPPLPKWEPKPKKELTEAQRRGAVNGGRASSEIQRERRTGQHRSLQAMQRYENREFNLEKRLKVFGVRAVAGEWGTHQPNQADLDRALRQARRLRTSSGSRRTTSLSEVLSGTRGNLVGKSAAEDRRQKRYWKLAGERKHGNLTYAQWREQQLGKRRKRPEGEPMFMIGGKPAVCRMVDGKQVLSVAKRDDRPGFWREGLSGSAEALKLKGQSATQPVPKEIRGAQLGVAAGAGLGGSMLTRALLPKGARPFAGPVAGALAATASVPGTNKLIQRKHPEYKVTAYGVTRRKTAPKRPSSKANVVSSRFGPTRSQIVPSDDRFSKRVFDDDDLEYMAQDDHVDIKNHYASIRLNDKDMALHRRDMLRKRRAWYRRQGLHDHADDIHYALEDVDQHFKMGRHAPRKKARVRKRDNESYLGSRTPYRTQRAAVTLAGHPPVIGPFTSAAAAGKYAPPGQGRKHALRQWGMGSGAGAVAGVGGAYAGAHLAQKSPRVQQAAETGVKNLDRAHNWARAKVGLGAKVRNLEPTASRLAASKLGKPLLSTRAGKVGALAGFLGTKAVVSGVGGQAAISLNQRDQKRYNAAHGVSKLAPPTGTKRDRHRLAERKRLNAALSYTSGGLGLGGLALMAAGKGKAATKTSILAGGVGGTNSLIGAGVQRREAKAVDPVAKGAFRPNNIHGAKGLLRPTKSTHVALGSGFSEKAQAVRRFGAGNDKIGGGDVDLFSTGGGPRSETFREAERAHRLRPYNKQSKGLHAGNPIGLRVQAGRSTYGQIAVGKRDPSRPPLKTSISEDDARKLVARHGLKGPLPKQLNREQRRAAYEARYVSAGGHKAEHWQHRAIAGDKVKTAGLAAATVAGIPAVGARTRLGRAVGRGLAHGIKPLRRISAHQVEHHATTAAGTAAVASGAGELYAAHARRKRSSYASAPAGVAASALRRMQNYDPETT